MWSTWEKLSGCGHGKCFYCRMHSHLTINKTHGDVLMHVPKKCKCHRYYRLSYFNLGKIFVDQDFSKARFHIKNVTSRCIQSSCWQQRNLTSEGKIWTMIKPWEKLLTLILDLFKFISTPSQILKYSVCTRGEREMNGIECGASVLEERCEVTC